MSSSTVNKTPSWEDDQKNPRLLYPFEPTQFELDECPFLNGLGGVLTLHRHPILVFFCNVAAVLRGCREMIVTNKQVHTALQEELETNEGNLRPEREQKIRSQIKQIEDIDAAYLSKALECESTIKKLKNGEYKCLEGTKITIEDLQFGGRFFCLNRHIEQIN